VPGHVADDAGAVDHHERRDARDRVGIVVGPRVGDVEGVVDRHVGAEVGDARLEVLLRDRPHGGLLRDLVAVVLRLAKAVHVRWAVLVRHAGVTDRSCGASTATAP